MDLGKKANGSTHENIHNKREESGAEEAITLPGFRFHPTDEELVGFYLKRKVEKKPISVEIIKEVDIYKYDPWDLPMMGGDGGGGGGGGGENKEWYLFCLRERKYRKSARPNRVTAGSGFWKATGVDRPIYGRGGAAQSIIGLKKSLVYYLGTAGKGTKTDWMMHEFRLPPHNTPPQDQAEVWTLCRVFERNKFCSNYIPPEGKVQSSVKSHKPNKENCSKRRSLEKQLQPLSQYSTDKAEPFGFTDNDLSFWQAVNGSRDYEVLREGNWDELRLVVDSAIIGPTSPGYYE